MRPDRLHHVLLASGASFLALAWACGAENDVAPPAVYEVRQMECRSFEELMPAFQKLLTSGETAGLAEVFREHLLVGEREGDAPPANDVMRAVFGTLAGFAELPPEEGAAEGQTCAVEPPPVSQAHPLCEMRRSLDVLVHQGKGVEALTMADPLLRAVMDYLVGRPPSSSTPHYEIATTLAGMCSQNQVCQMNDTLDLVIGLTAFMETPEGARMLNGLDGLVGKPELQPFLSSDGATYGGRSGIIALVRLLNTTVLGMEDTSALDTLETNVIDTLPTELRGEARLLVGDLKLMLDPARKPNVLQPLKKVVNCLNVQDPNLNTIGMVYDLGFEADIPEFGLTNIARVVKGLRETDPRGSLVHLVQTLAKAVRSDQLAVDSAAKVCNTLFSTKRAEGKTQSNAELALPVLADIFSKGIAKEALCAADTLIYGCTGGTVQPACAP